MIQQDTTYLEGHSVQEMAYAGRLWGLIASTTVDIEAHGGEMTWSRVCRDTQLVGKGGDLDRGGRRFCTYQPSAFEGGSCGSDDASSLAHRWPRRRR